MARIISTEEMWWRPRLPCWVKAGRAGDVVYVTSLDSLEDGSLILIGVNACDTAVRPLAAACERSVSHWPQVGDRLGWVRAGHMVGGVVERVHFDKGEVGVRADDGNPCLLSIRECYVFERQEARPHGRPGLGKDLAVTWTDDRGRKRAGRTLGTQPAMLNAGFVAVLPDDGIEAVHVACEAITGWGKWTVNATYHGGEFWVLGPEAVAAEAPAACASPCSDFRERVARLLGLDPDAPAEVVFDTVKKSWQGDSDRVVAVLRAHAALRIRCGRAEARAELAADGTSMDDLNRAVTVAIVQAEHGGRREEWLAVAEAEAAIAARIPCRIVEGRIARIGVLTALMSAGAAGLAWAIARGWQSEAVSHIRWDDAYNDYQKRLVSLTKEAGEQAKLTDK